MRKFQVHDDQGKPVELEMNDEVMRRNPDLAEAIRRLNASDAHNKGPIYDEGPSHNKGPIYGEGPAHNKGPAYSKALDPNPKPSPAPGPEPGPMP